MDPNTAAAAPGQGQRKTSPWVYAGCGCAVLLVLTAVVCLFVVKKLADQGHRMEQGLADPKVREQRTRELLSYRELPAGYYPAGALSLPYLLDMAFLGDHSPAAGETHVDIEDHGFIFIKMHWGKIPAEAGARRRMLYGANGKAPWEQGSGFRVEIARAAGRRRGDGRWRPRRLPGDARRRPHERQGAPRHHRYPDDRVRRPPHPHRRLARPRPRAGRAHLHARPGRHARRSAGDHRLPRSFQSLLRRILRVTAPELSPIGRAVSAGPVCCRHRGIEELIRRGHISASPPIGDEQIQPASLDLRLGPIGYRVRASFLPNNRSTVAAKLASGKTCIFEPQNPEFKSLQKTCRRNAVFSPYRPSRRAMRSCIANVCIL